MKSKFSQLIQKETIYRVFGGYLVFLLFGYIFFNKWFAYLGFGKLYVSEVGIAIGILSTIILWIRRELFWHRLKQPAVILLLIFVGWGIARTLPYIHLYGLNAIRDAMLWGYGIYAFFICLIFPKNYLDNFIKLYNRALPFILIWLPVSFLLYWFAGLQFSLFGAPAPVLFLKSGDMGVVLGAIAAFLLLRLDQGDRPYSKWTRTGLWVLWWVAFVMYGVISRASMFSALIGMVAVLFVRPKSDWLRPVATGAIILGFLFFSGFSVHVPDPTRNVSISLNQVKINFLSLVGIGADQSGIQPLTTPSTPSPATPLAQSEDLRIGTMKWRLDWWKKIANYTVKGLYFWAGKGYGINLADDDGFQVMPDHSLRNPHNAFMTVLARSGVPGLALWLGFLGVLFFQAARMIYLRPPWSDHLVVAWVTIYLFVLLFNAFFDVFLEGPMGGIWFWSMVGILMLYFSEYTNIKKELKS
jgi:hypothetical protein